MKTLLEKLNQLTEKMADVTERVAQIERPVPPADEPESATEDDNTDEEAANPQTLRDDAALQRRIDKRMRELNLTDASSDDEEHQTTRGKTRQLKSGRDKTAAECVHIPVEWPHYYVFRGADRRPARYDDLTVAEFVSGYMNIVMQKLDDTKTTKLMLMHLNNIMHDATLYSWQTARNCHAIILQHIEQGRIDWTDTDTMKELRQTYAQVRQNANGENGRQNSRGHTGPVFCLKYQTDSCQYDGDHHTTRGLIKHVCAYCLKTSGAFRRHSESTCRNKKKNNESPKNEEEG